MKKGRGEAGGSALASFVSLRFGSLEAGSSLSSASASSVSLPLVRLCHRLISRDRPTKTGRLYLCSPFFYVAALNVRI